MNNLLEPTPYSTWRVACSIALLMSLAAATVGCQAQTNDPQAQYLAGFTYYQKGDYADACKAFQAAAAQGHVASQSMIQLVNGSGHACSMPRIRSAAPALPGIRALYAGALTEAQAWQRDALLTYAQVSNDAHPGYYTISFLFVSPSARQTLSLVSSERGGLVGTLSPATEVHVLPSNFLDLAAAVEAAHRAGMQGAVQNATLTVWQGKHGPPLAGWLLYAPGNRFQTFLIGALDGRAYPVAQYSYLSERDDDQLRAMQQTMRQSATAPRPAPQGDPCSSNSMVPMSARLAPWTPCNRAAVMRVYQQSVSNYDMWQRGLRPTED